MNTNDFMISVHVLGEFLFCHRAAINAFCDEDDGKQPESILRLDYQPSYELDDLERRLNTLAGQLWQLTILACTFLLAGVIAGRVVHGSLLLGGLVASGYFVWQFAKRLPDTFRLLKDHRSAGRAEPHMPNVNVPFEEQVNWWSLLAAGFTSQPCRELLTDPEWRLCGRPWRILRYGNLAIPVYVRNSAAGGIQPSQRIRIIAYCQLIRKNEGHDSPYGIVMNQGTFRGTVLKTSPGDVHELQQVVNQARSEIRTMLQHDVRPAPPVDANICRGCPHGRPRILTMGRSETTILGTVIPPLAHRSSQTQYDYHSNCGDRFGWLPPHADSRSLGLHPQTQTFT